jgi:RimJ/RimL family protein N-acetyltransferase
MMPTAADYATFELLRDGKRVEIRAFRPDDRANLLAAVSRLSPKTLYRRFFGPKRGFSEKEISYFTNIDFANHVALVVMAEERGKPVIIAGARYIVVEPGRAEVAFVVIDSYQGRGIGSLLLRHLAALARGSGLKEFVAEVLPDNTGMLKVFEKSGLRPKTKQQHGSVHITMQLG